MKRLTMLIGILVGFAAVAQGQQFALVSSITTSVESKVAKLGFESTVHDFGTIEHKSPVTATFEFRNNGETPLIITEAKGSCGCTVADYTKTTVAPGEMGKVTATYNAAKLGAFQKSVTVTANTDDGPIKLMIKGEVVAAE